MTEKEENTQWEQTDNPPAGSRTHSSPPRSKRFWAHLLFTLVAVAAFTVFGVASEARTVRIGIYDNMPNALPDKSGKTAGILIDLLEEMAKREKWKLVYVPCDWSECLRALKDGRIDLIPDVSYSPARDEKLDFHKIHVAESWSQVYSNPGLQISRMSDLNGRRVAVLHGSIQEKTMLQRTMNGFGYNVTIVPAESREEAFRMASKGSADAVIANHFVGDLLYQEYGLVKTTIVFNVKSLYYATAQGRNSELLEAIDHDLGAWIKQPNSPYYQALKHWSEKPPKQVMPRYFLWVFSIIAGLFVFAVGIIVLLRLEVGGLTRRLRKAKSPLAAGKAVSDKSSKQGSRETILIVDDEKGFTDMLSEFLGEHGYNPVVAGSSKEALGIFKKNHGGIKLVVLNIMLHGMDGREIFIALRHIRHDVKVVLCSWHSVEWKAKEIMNHGACAFIQKQFDCQNLLKNISDVLPK